MSEIRKLEFREFTHNIQSVGNFLFNYRYERQVQYVYFGKSNDLNLNIFENMANL